MATRVPEPEFDARLTEVRGHRRVRGGVLRPDEHRVSHHVQTERPVVLAVTDERVAVTVPRLEVERVDPVPRIDAVHHYFDYPGGAPIEAAAGMLDDLGVESVVSDADGAPGVMGYEGPDLSAFVDVGSQSWVDRMRWEKTDAEVDLIRESATWANLGHRYLAEHTEVGAHPATVSQRASMEASRAMLDALGERYAVRVRGGGPVQAGYISGSETALPHGHTPNERLSEGDVLITGASANVDGYRSELERTMFVGDYTDEQEHYFEVMLEAQTIAMDALGPGVPVAHVDQRVWDYFDEQGVSEYARHHVGHNIGLGAHEPPYLDRGWGASDHVDESDATTAPGQVYTVEPGIYTDEFGYRHSDTVVVTETGTERLTFFPRDIESNVVG